MKQTILVVEDEPRIAKIICDYLKHDGFATHIIENGLEVVSWLQQNLSDLILLDLMLPGCNGLDVLREIRSFSQLPVIIITAKGDEKDRLSGLDFGADDYICKPFSPREVVARVKTVLRRIPQSDQDEKGKLIFLDRRQCKFFVQEQNVELTVLEFRMMDLLISSPGQIFSRSHLMNRIYEDERVVNDRTIDSHIKKIRKRIVEIFNEDELICSVYGLGYKFNERYSAQIFIRE
jgi:two-component system response regulator BaeR